MKEICYKLVLTKDFEGVDIRFGLHKDLIFDSLDEALEVGRLYLTKLNCEVKIYEIFTELVSVL